MTDQELQNMGNEAEAAAQPRTVNMDIGTGIAIAGVWIFAGMMGISKSVSAKGLWLGIIAATIITIILI